MGADPIEGADDPLVYAAVPDGAVTTQESLEDLPPHGVEQPALRRDAPAWLRQLAQTGLPYIAAFVLVLGAYLGASRHINDAPPTGDEPSYILDAFSIARDGDRDLTNQFSFENPKPLIALFGIPAFPHGYKWTDAGFISWHGAGLGAALAPGVWIGDSLDDVIKWMRLELVLIDALTAVALLALLRRLAALLCIREVLAWVAWASAALSLPLVAYADQFYPEVPALLCVLIALNVVLRRARPLSLAFGATTASYLPWLHVRFVPICVGLLGALAVRGLWACAERRGSPSGWPGVRDGIRTLTATARSRAGASVLVAVVIPGLVSFVAMAAAFQYWYGSPSWSAAALPATGPPTPKASSWYPEILGGLFGTDYGWFPWAPVLLLGLAGVGCLWLVSPRWASYAVLVLLPYQYLLGSSGITTPGFVYPGRYEIVWLPLLAVPLMIVLARIPVAWLAFVPLLLATLVVSWQAAHNSGYLLLNTGEIKLPAAAHLQAAFPDIEHGSEATSFGGNQGTYLHPIGRVVDEGRASIARPSDGKGYLQGGPQIKLTPGSYLAHFTMHQTGATGREPVANVQAVIPPRTVLAQRDVTAAEVSGGAPKDVTLGFGSPGASPIDLRVLVYGNATVRLGDSKADPIAIAPQPTLDRYPNAALMFGWVGGIVFVGALFVSIMRRRLDQPMSAPA